MEYNNLVETQVNDWKIMWVSSHFKPNVFDNITPQQKINHFPGSTGITHKDSLAQNIRKQKTKFGEDYNFTPETFVLPEEYAEAREKIEKIGGIWICKPYSQSQGKGIFLVDNSSQIPENTNCIISQYIGNPLFISILTIK